MIEGTPVEVAAQLLRYVVPCKAETVRQQAGAMLREQDKQSAISGQRSTGRAVSGRHKNASGKFSGRQAVGDWALAGKPGKPPVAPHGAVAPHDASGTPRRQETAPSARRQNFTEGNGTNGGGTR